VSFLKFKFKTLRNAIEPELSFYIEYPEIIEDICKTRLVPRVFIFICGRFS